MAITSYDDVKTHFKNGNTVVLFVNGQTLVFNADHCKDDELFNDSLLNAQAGRVLPKGITT